MEKKASKEQLYAQVVCKAYQAMSEYTKFRHKYPKEIPFQYCDPDKNCSWCGRKDRKQKFTEEDIKNAGSVYCQYRIEEEFRELNEHSGMEPCLYGEFLTTMVEINKYVITTESVLDPDEAITKWAGEDGPNPLGFTFNTTKNMAIKICNFVKEHYPDYHYIIVDTIEGKIIDVKENKESEDSYVNSMMVVKGSKGGGNFPSIWWDEFKGLFDGEDRMMEVSIEDPKWERRDLYKNILGVLERVCVDQTKVGRDCAGVKN